MPKGRVAPGKVLPPPAVPMNGSTESYGLRLDWARAGRIERTKKKTRQKRRKTRTRIPCVLGEKVSPKANHSSPAAACADGDGGDTSGSIGRTRKEDQIAIGIHDEEGSGAPRFRLQCLTKAHSCGLVNQKKLVDLVRGSDGDRGGEQMLTLPNIANEHGFANHSQIEPRMVARDLPVVRRIAIHERDREAQLFGKEIARCLDVGNDQLCFG